MDARQHARVRWALVLGGILIALTRAAAIAHEVHVVRILASEEAKGLWSMTGVFGLEIIGLGLALGVPVYALVQCGADGRPFMVNLTAFFLLMGGGASEGQMKKVLGSVHPESVGRIPIGENSAYIVFTDPRIPVVLSLVPLLLYLVGAALWWWPGRTRSSGSPPVTRP